MSRFADARIWFEYDATEDWVQIAHFIPLEHILKIVPNRLVNRIVMMNEWLVDNPAAHIQQRRDQLRHQTANGQMIAAKLEPILDLSE